MTQRFLPLFVGALLCACAPIPIDHEDAAGPVTDGGAPLDPTDATMAIDSGSPPPPEEECPVGTSACGTQCVDLASSAAHCGACGDRCTDGPNETAVCTDGACARTCAAGFADCDGDATNGCETDLSSDASDCGTCGHACTTTGGTPACVEGTCTIATCGMSFVDCDGDDGNGCETNVTTSTAHCGACANLCPSAPHAAARCTSALCSFTCDPGFADCDVSPGNGCEAELSTSIAACGSCGNACPTPPHATAVCSSGACVFTCAPGYGDCDGLAGNGCEVDLSSAGSCGACGRACSAPAHATAVCSASACSFTCRAGFADCNGNPADGCEANLDTSRTACGACGRVCAAAPNATAACTSGACGLTCGSGYADCDGAASNGCEASLRTVDDCGACGVACPAAAHGVAVCTASGCDFTCGAGYDDCDGLAENGCEVDLRSSVASCGGCGRTCTAPANATATCSAAACGFTCRPGFADCNGNAADGCEASLSTGAASCGGCGRVCAAPANGVAVCTSGACGFTCGSGYADCDGAASNGCEVGLRTVDHCGDCGTVCSAPAHATAVCTASGCGFTCSAGYGDCDGIASNGCEVDLTRSATHCGSCSTTCGTARTCEASACREIPVFEWQRTIGSSYSDSALGVAVDGGGNSTFVGHFAGNANFGTDWTSAPGGIHESTFIAHYDPAGALLWSRTYGAEGYPSRANAVAVDSAGNVYVAMTITMGTYFGTTYLRPVAYGYQASVVVSYTPSGTVRWAVGWGGGSGNDPALGIAVDDAGGGVYVTGLIGSTSMGTLLSANGTGYLVRLTTAGTTEWIRQLDRAGAAVTTGPGGNAYVAALDNAYSYSPTGTQRWSTYMSGALTTSVTVTPGGTSYFGGNLYGGLYVEGTLVLRASTASGVTDSFVLSLDSNGAYRWGHLTGSASTVTGLARDSHGSLVFAGGRGASGVVVGVLDDSGAPVWWRTYSTPTTLGGQATAIAIDATDHIVLGGGFSTSMTFDRPSNPALVGAGGSSDTFFVRLRE